MTASTVYTGSRPAGALALKFRDLMKDNPAYQLPVWAYRLKKSDIERLYRSCSTGILDDELIDEVGFGLLARCMSMLQVAEAIRGRPVCPQCDVSAEVNPG